MQINHVQIWSRDLALVRPYTIAYRTIDSVANFFISVHLSTGVVGLGAGSPAEAVTGENLLASVLELQQQLPGLLKGKTPEEALAEPWSKHFPGRPAATVAIEMALFDALAQSQNQSLLEYFGRAIEPLPTSITIGIKNDPAEALAEAREYHDRGFTHLKLKTGRNVASDIEYCRLLREACGPDTELRVDANQGYTTADLARFYEATLDYGVELIEQPLPAGQQDKLRELPWDIRKICAADEGLHTTADLDRLCDPEPAYGVFNIKLMKCGGLREARHIGHHAQELGIELMWGCNDESVVSISAALHTALSLPNTHYLDLDGSFDLAEDIATGGFSVQRGILYPDMRGGLGVELKES